MTPPVRPDQSLTEHWTLSDHVASLLVDATGGEFASQDFPVAEVIALVRAEVAREIRADMRTLDRKQSPIAEAVWSAYDHAAYIADNGTDADL